MTRQKMCIRDRVHADRKVNGTEHGGHYNAAITNEVSVIVVNQECDKRDMVIHARNDKIHQIAETNWAYNALLHHLMFFR